MKLTRLLPLLLAGTASAAEPVVIENECIRRSFTIENGTLQTTGITNRLAGTTITPAPAPEFQLRLSHGTGQTEPDTILSSADFQVTDHHRLGDDRVQILAFDLASLDPGLKLTVSYSLASDEPFLRKSITITSDLPWILERIDVEALGISDAYQPYTKDSITAHAPGNWSPNLGQPLYTRQSGIFWGVEFPAARNQVDQGLLRAGYLRGLPLEPGKPYLSHSAVCGVTDDPAFVADAFFEYIDRIRIRPLRLQTQYNSWFDYGGGVSREKFAASVARIHHELNKTRGVRPLSRYVIDDGWQDSGADWSDMVWKVNQKFDSDFAATRKAVAAAGSQLGLWLSPGCLFGARRQVPKLREQGFEALDDWMSMAGPRYMQALEDRMADLTESGVGFFKLDGVFGHLNLRNFELHGSRYGLPEMPQLDLDGLKAGSKELNDPKFDELKLYYLSAGTERLMQIFKRLAEIDPDIYLVISNGAYLSPWWLMHVDAVWMINAGDAAKGSSRTSELVYRDGRYHKIFQQENTQFPLNALFNHEPKKTRTGESKKEFREYLYMHLSRGTGFVELYIKPFNLSAADWDVLAEGMLWAEQMLPAFKHARMHGGDPAQQEAYGYSGWTANGGYLSLHNPSDKQQQASLTLNRELGLAPGSGPFHLSSPLAESTTDLPKSVAFGDQLSLQLAPGEIRLLHFDVKPRDWSALRALQTRSPEPEPVDLTGHPIIGAWSYRHGGVPHTRTFTTDGRCTLRAGTEIQWTKPFDAINDKLAVVKGGLRHEIQKDGTLKIENRYTATR